jgi:hypothetical protein
VIGVIANPTGYAIWISLLDRMMTKFIGWRNFEYVLGRDRFWLVLFNTALSALVGVVVKAFDGPSASPTSPWCRSWRSARPSSRAASQSGGAMPDRG